MNFNDEIKPVFYELPGLEEETLDWYALSHAERFEESTKLWDAFILAGGSLDPEPDTQSPFNTFEI
jgi:hypothetical protein